MENEKNNIEKGKLTKYPLPKWNKSDELYETISEKLSWVSKDYRDVINGESESDEKITEKDIYEADISDIEKRLDKGSIAYKIFNKLRQQGLKIFINPKTDISRTEKGFNIIRGLGKITQQTRGTMSADNNCTDEQLYINKLVHEMGHCLSSYVSSEGNNLFRLLYDMRSNNVSITKLGNIDRYEDLKTKASEDAVEFARMYMQNPDEFKKYLGQICKSPKTANLLYEKTENRINAALNK